MPTVGFHASHEQLAPSALLAAVQRAEEAGFDGIYLHHVGREQDRFLETFGAKVVPDLR